MWCAWIPTINSRLTLLPPSGTGLKKVERANQLIYSSLIYAFERVVGRQTIADDWSLFEVKAAADDIDKNRLYTVTFLFDGHLIPRALILWSSEDPGFILCSAEIRSVDLDSGMISMDCRFNNPDDASWLPKHLYAFVRNLYHQHVWTHSDFALFPVEVEVDDPQAAGRIIWERYYGERIIVELKQSLRNIFFKIEAADPDKWLHILQVCAAGIGELYYGKALCEHAQLGERYQEACSRGLGTFKNIQSLIEEKIANLQHKEKKTINSRHIFYTIVGTVAVAVISRPELITSPSKASWVTAGIVVSAGSLVFAYKLWRKRYFRTLT